MPKKLVLGLLFLITSQLQAQRLGDNAVHPSLEVADGSYATLLNIQVPAIRYADLFFSIGNTHVIQDAAPANSDFTTHIVGILIHQPYFQSGKWSPYGAFAYLHLANSHPSAHNFILQGGAQYITSGNNVFRPSLQRSILQEGHSFWTINAEWQWQWHWFFVGAAGMASLDDMGATFTLGWRLARFAATDNQSTRGRPD